MPSTMRLSSNTVLDSLASVKMVVLWRRIIRNTSWGWWAGVSAKPSPPRAARHPRRPQPRTSAPPPAPAHHLSSCLSHSTRRRGRAPPRSRRTARCPPACPAPGGHAPAASILNDSQASRSLPRFGRHLGALARGISGWQGGGGGGSRGGRAELGVGGTRRWCANLEVAKVRSSWARRGCRPSLLLRISGTTFISVGYLHISGRVNE